MIRVFDKCLNFLGSFIAHYGDSVKKIGQLPNGYIGTIVGDNKVKIWNITSITNWTLIQTFSNHSNTVSSFEYINEDMIASGGYDNMIHIWYFSTGLKNRTINTGNAVYALKLMRNGFHLAACVSNTLKIYNLYNGNLISSLPTGVIMSDIAQIDDDMFAFSGLQIPYGIFIWNLTSKTSKFNLTGHTSYVRVLKKISTDLLVSGSDDATVRVWNITDGTLIKNMTGHTSWIYSSVDVLSDGKTVVSGSGDKTIKLWDVNTGECLNTNMVGVGIRSLAVLNVTLSKYCKN
jgi:WD40 repeat protein